MVERTPFLRVVVGSIPTSGGGMVDAPKVPTVEMERHYPKKNGVS